MIRVKKLCKAYSKGGQTLQVLDHLDLEMEEGRFYALMGPSGSGKTTLLNMVGGLDRPDSGEIFVAGEDLNGLDGAALAHFRAENVGFVFQGFNLIPVLTALENVELPLTLSPLSRRERRKHAEYALELVGLSDRKHHRPKQLSGGQEQRVAIARAVASDPKVILADEPTANLDSATSEQIIDLMLELNKEQGVTFLFSTHDPRAAERAKRTLHLEKGVLLEQEVAA